jgi:hypothetical protein
VVSCATTMPRARAGFTMPCLSTLLTLWLATLYLSCFLLSAGGDSHAPVNSLDAGFTILCPSWSAIIVGLATMEIDAGIKPLLHFVALFTAQSLWSVMSPLISPALMAYSVPLCIPLAGTYTSPLPSYSTGLTWFTLLSDHPLATPLLRV